MAFLVVVSALLGTLVGMAAILHGEVVGGLVICACAVIIGTYGVDIFGS